MTFETRAYCGLDRDNIYTISTGDTGSPLGVLPTTISGPANARDSLLVHDPDTFGVTSGRHDNDRRFFTREDIDGDTTKHPRIHAAGRFSRGVVRLVLVLLVSTLHAMTREHYFRTVCAAHLAEIGTTMFVYATDNETALPRTPAGPRQPGERSRTGVSPNDTWHSDLRQTAPAARQRSTRVSISS